MNRLLTLRPALMNAVTTATEKGAPAQSQRLRGIDPAGGPATFRLFATRVNADAETRRLIDPPEAALHQDATPINGPLIPLQTDRTSAKETR